MTDPISLTHHLAIDGAPVNLIWLEAHEELDAIGLLRCEVIDHEGGPDPAAIVGKPVVLTLTRRAGDEEHRIAGTIVEAERTTTRGAGETGTLLVARHRLFRLTQRADCRIFKDKPAPDIVKEVLLGAGIPASSQRWKLSGSYPKRPHTAQYRESDLAFVRRLLAEEGIAFFVDTNSGSEVVVFFDGATDVVEGEAEIAFRPAEGLTAAHDAITTLSHERSTAAGRVHLRDYDFERPSFKLDAKAVGDDPAERPLEVYEHPGRFTDKAVGDRYARVLLESLRARREMVTGTANTLRLQPGRRFTLAEHPYEPLNREYLLVEVDIALDARRTAARRGAPEGEAERITFRAIPTEKTPYRPVRVPRAVSAAGAQVAVTTGPPGKEIHPDKHGRVKVLFPWDRRGKVDDSSSDWIRTTQVPLGGGMLTPRVGWEVGVNFIGGDPDRPFVGGRLYNATSPPPYALPANKTRMSLQTATTPGGGSTNEIRMEDKAGGEEMFMNASRDGAVSARNNVVESVGNNEKRSIGANHSLAVTDSMSASITANQELMVGAKQKVSVGTFMVDEVGSHVLSVAGDRDLKAGGDHKRTVTGSSTLNVGGSQFDLVAGSVDESTLNTMTDSVGAALVELTARDRTVNVTGARNETAGALKAVLSGAGRSVSVGADLHQNAIGGIASKVSGDRQDVSTSNWIEIAGGAQMIKAANVVFEAETLLSVVMGASTITLTPYTVSIAGLKITFDGDCNEVGLIKDN